MAPRKELKQRLNDNRWNDYLLSVNLDSGNFPKKSNMVSGQDDKKSKKIPWNTGRRPANNAAFY